MYETTGKLRIWSVLVPAMIVPSIGALFYFVIFTDCWFTPIIYVTTKVFIIAWPSVCAYSVLGKRIGRVISRPTRHTQAIGTGILLGASIAALMFGLMQTTLGQVVIASSESIESKAHTLKIMRHYWLFALFLSVAHSLIEEYYWRWFVFGNLRNIIAIPYAHGLAGLAFATHHIVITTQLFGLFWGIVLGGFVATGGIVWSLMYQRQKTLIGAWISHLIIDLGIMVIGHRILFGGYT